MKRYFASVILLLVLIVPSLVQAQNGSGITLKPATIEENIDPGATKQFLFSIKNESGADQTYYLSRRDIVGVRDGNVPVYADENIQPTQYDMSQWITLSTDTISVAAGSEVPVAFMVTVPQDAPPCSHFAGIFVSMEPPELRESGAAIGYEVANIISLRVSGECEEVAQIRQFSTDNYIYGSPNVTFNVRIENGGNTLVRPTGPMEITNMFGTKVDGGLIFNESAAAVFPGDTREFTLDWAGEGYGFGRYEAVVSPVYGEEGAKQTMSSTVTFWVLPMKIVLPALGILTFLLLSVYIGAKLYVRRKLSYYTAVGTRKLVRRKSTGNPLLLIFLVMLTVTALFFIVLLVLFA
ncbi:MAG: small integral membrane protein 8 [Candidatus Pacebacteria bacterium]|jgi:hypothetical protein|nr:small integral membrane protein 8 [Candidatus Paceibacterota bacterium]